MGILRYNRTKPDSDKDPLSTPFLFDIQCADEPYESIEPWKRWTVKNPANNSLTHYPLATPFLIILIYLLELANTEYQVSLKESSGPPYVPDKQLVSRRQIVELYILINFAAAMEHASGPISS